MTLWNEYAYVVRVLARQTMGFMCGDLGLKLRRYVCRCACAKLRDRQLGSMRGGHNRGGMCEKP